MIEDKLRDSVVRWRDLISIYFPEHIGDGLWSHHRTNNSELPSQGWKLHVSATIISATDVLAAVCRVLDVESVSCKTLHDLRDLLKLNGGMHFGYSQIGKLITFYPKTDEKCVQLGKRLVAATAGLPGPAVPFERRLSPNSPVFARYGVFVGQEGKLSAPGGQHIADSREINPSWAIPPQGLFKENDDVSIGPLGTRYVAYEAVVQRGKGGVYLALDLASGPRKCVVKEGRCFGEVDGNGVDGQSRTGVEYLNLLALRARGINVPLVYDRFQQGGNTYVVLEFIKGHLLAEIRSSDCGQTTTLPSARQLSIQLSEMVAAIHAAGFVWRDLKATNIILTPEGELRPIDFEGSLLNGTPLQALWGSPGHLPAEWATSERADFSHDLFSLGTLIRQLHASQDEQSQPDNPLLGLLSPVREIVEKLLSTNAEERPPAAQVAAALRN